jgi:hypothetical protein
MKHSSFLLPLAFALGACSSTDLDPVPGSPGQPSHEASSEDGLDEEDAPRAHVIFEHAFSETGRFRVYESEGGGGIQPGDLHLSVTARADDELARQLMTRNPSTDLPVDVFAALSPDTQVPAELRVLSERAARQKAAELKAANLPPFGDGALVDASDHDHADPGALVEKSSSFFWNTVCPDQGWYTSAQCHYETDEGLGKFRICVHDWEASDNCPPGVAYDHGYNEHWQSTSLPDRLYAWNETHSDTRVFIRLVGTSDSSSSFSLLPGYWGHGYWWYYPGGALGSAIKGRMKDNQDSIDDYAGGLTIHYYDKDIQ